MKKKLVKKVNLDREKIDNIFGYDNKLADNASEACACPGASSSCSCSGGSSESCACPGASSS